MARMLDRLRASPPQEIGGLAVTALRGPARRERPDGAAQGRDRRGGPQRPDLPLRRRGAGRAAAERHRAEGEGVRRGVLAAVPARGRRRRSGSGRGRRSTRHSIASSRTSREALGASGSTPRRRWHRRKIPPHRTRRKTITLAFFSPMNGAGANTVDALPAPVAEDERIAVGGAIDALHPGGELPHLTEIQRARRGGGAEGDTVFFRALRHAVDEPHRPDSSRDDRAAAEFVIHPPVDPQFDQLPRPLHLLKVRLRRRPGAGRAPARSRGRRGRRTAAGEDALGLRQ